MAMAPSPPSALAPGSRVPTTARGKSGCSPSLPRAASLGSWEGGIAPRCPALALVLRRHRPPEGSAGIARGRASRRTPGPWVVRAELRAVVFDCDGVILESEDLHRRAYNAAFEHFAVRCPGEAPRPVHWDEEFYDALQNRVGGGKPKMRWYFSKHGWPHSNISDRPPVTDEARTVLIDTLQDWKSNKYQELIGSGAVPARPGVVELMDEARAQGLKVAVCSAATKSSVVFTLQSLLGRDRFERLDCFMAGDDVPRKKPDPVIYQLACQRLGVGPDECIVVEDSLIGLQAATGANMPCIITYTSSTRNQDFSEAVAVVPSLDGIRIAHLEELVSRSSEPLRAL